MECPPFDPAGCLGDVIGGGVSGIAGTAFNAIVHSFMVAANTLLESFGSAFVAIPPIDPTSPAVRSVYLISIYIAGVIAALLLLGQVIRTAVTHDGSALAQGLIGVGKAGLAFLLTTVIAGASLRAADELTEVIVVRSFGSTRALTARFTGLIAWNAVGQQGALLLLLAVIAILLTLVLWFELLLRNAAVAVLVATSPIAAAGQVSEATRSWWTKFAVATGQLIVLKPIIALVFAVGFGLTGKGKDVQSVLAGMLVLILAVFAWPAIARFFSFASVEVGGSTGLGALLGFAAGRAGSGVGSGAPAGVDPDEFSQASEARTMASFAHSGDGASAAAGAGTAAVAGPAAVMVSALQAAQRAINSLSGGMDQMAAHAGMSGRPATYAAGAPHYAGRARYRHPYGSGTSAPGNGSLGGVPVPVPDSSASGEGWIVANSSWVEPFAQQPSAAESPAEIPVGQVPAEEANPAAPDPPAVPAQPEIEEVVSAPQPRPIDDRQAPEGEAI
ncbi:hypothetical protein Sme01_38470 [Sphaerisporangium melleum]|uniref:Conjugal transfer protein TrbL n=1 Tax=Sphaerisporangium melleum TaxID=321316 RepID=A0A917VIC3_9ACTN|nr:hypothetical protein [Sphaerisporangium melleum]GGK82137.1 hypothetical protein GCM10007964_26020 [Sphaerisporangium melleum]GII71371.1 hypothetical protein Sme01_38470 [Sphaerisporangium melleum]